MISKEQKVNLIENMIHFSNIDNIENIGDYFPIDSIFCMDTESCSSGFNYEKVISNKYSLLDFTKPLDVKVEVKSNNKKETNSKPIKEVIHTYDYNHELLQPITIEKEKQSKKPRKEWNVDYDKRVHVYAWAISNEKSDKVIYGENIDDMLPTFYKIITKQITKQVKNEKTIGKVKCFVHNLGWDLEFLKYSLVRNGYKHYVQEFIQKGNQYKAVGKQPKNTFTIVEANNNVYSSTVYLNKEHTVKNKNGKSIKYPIIIDFIDSFKIMAKSLDTIAKEVISIDDMYKKMGAKYDYKRVRPIGYKLNDLELAYLYNDVYILKEFVRQFYTPLNTEQTTASAISFEKFLEITYKGVDNTENYNYFLNDFPNLTNYKTITDLVRESYKGGWTQCNRRYINIKQYLDNAVSIDINSSYPAVVKTKILPYGEPEYFEGFISKEECERYGYQLRLLKIEFDGFKNKQADNLIGEIQVGGNNVTEFGLRGTDYVHTNIVGGEIVGDTIINYTKLLGTKKPSKRCKYTWVIWDFELENILENMELYLIDKEYDEDEEEWYEVSKTLIKGYNVIETLMFKGKLGHFQEAVEYFTELKIKSKKEGNKSMTEFAKLVLNSFYGKMASNDERLGRPLAIFDDGSIDVDTALLKDKEIYNKFYYKANKKYYPAFASCVTAWARVNLRTTLYKIGYNNVIYWDTDSLYTRVNADYIKEKCGDILHPTELGKWDLEKTYTEFKCIGAKKYILKTTDGEILCKCAGLPSEVRDTIDFDNFYLGNTFYGKKVKTKMIGGYDLIEGEFKLSDTNF